jgi:hypothetical protein
MMLIGLAAVVLPVQGATYYVTKSGSDSNGCTQAQPCLTITRASKVATAAGDIVQIGPGTYSERVTLTTSGTAAGKITFRGHDGSGCPTVSNPDINSRGVRPAPTVTMQGFTIGANYLSLQCLKITNGSGAAFDIRSGTTDIDMTDNVADASGSPGSPWVGVNMPTVALSSMPQNITFSRNYVVNTIYGVMVFCKNNCVFSDNEIYQLKATGDGDDNDYFRFFGNNITFENNYMHGNSLTDCVGDCHIDCFQTFNVANSPYELAQNVTFNRNFCVNADEGIISRDVANGTGASTLNTHKNYKVINNVFTKGPLGTNSISPSGRGMSWCGIFGHTGNILWANNVCDGSLVGYAEASTGTHRNNIHYNGGWMPYTASLSGSIAGSIVSDHNLLYESGRTYSGFAGDVLNKNPLFVNAASMDYHLQSTSPAKDAGVDVGVAMDRDGNVRPQGTGYDIGAYEYGTGGGTNPAPLPPSSLQLTIR